MKQALSEEGRISVQLKLSLFLCDFNFVSVALIEIDKGKMLRISTSAHWFFCKF